MMLKGLILFCIFIYKTLQEELNYKIAMPKYICDKDGSVKEIESDLTTIRLLGKDAQNLDYKFSVNFKTIGRQCRNTQRCTLLTWKAVRELEEYLRKYPTVEKGLIEINNTMLLPGIKYYLNVTVLNGNNMVEQKQFSMDFVDEEVKKAVQKPLAAILLLGSDQAYAFMNYVVNAEITICSNISGYFFTWDLLDGSSKPISKFSDRGAELKLEPNIFHATNNYHLKCDLDVQKVNVMTRGILVKLPFTLTTTRPNEPINIQAYVVDLDNTDGEFKITWTCRQNGTICDAPSDNSELNIEGGFSDEGSYQLTIEVSKGDITETRTTEVLVINSAPPIEIDTVETPISPSTGVEIRANINELKASCTLQWLSVEKEGYEYLNLNDVPGSVNEMITVVLKEDLFLNELEEFSNGTVDKSHNLLIPPPAGTWKGLQGDKKYYFRLNVTCPSTPDNDSDVEYIDESTEEDFVSTFAEVTIETNSAPVLKPLEISPNIGEALKTSFSFKTQKADDKEEDKPILYKFGYVVGNRDVVVSSMIDVLNINHILPYAENGIQVYLEGCDVFNSCGRIIGPTIKTKLPKENGVVRINALFNDKLMTEEYYKAFSLAYSVLQTYKSMGSTTDVNNFQDYYSKTVNNRIQQLRKFSVQDDQWKERSNRLIKNINDFNKDLSFSEEVLNNIVTLRNEISQNSKFSKATRRLLSMNNLKQEITMEYVKGYLEVSELVVTGSADPKKVEAGKENLRNEIDDFMEKLCKVIYKNGRKIQIELKTVAFAVEKLHKNYLNNYITIPFETSSWGPNANIKLGNLSQGRQKNKICIGKAVFKDYINREGNVYMAKLFHANSDDGAEIKNVYVQLILPADETRILGKLAQCMVYNNNEWQPNCKVHKQNTKFAQCSCSSLGYFALDYVENVTTTDAVSQANVTPQSSTESTSTGNTTAVEIVVTQPPITSAYPTDETEITLETTEIVEMYGNSSQENSKIIKENNNSFETVSYIVIGVSAVGIIVLAIILCRITSSDEDDTITDDFDFPKYAQLYDEEMLNDEHM